MKDKMTHYDSMDKQQQICGSVSVFCIVRKTGTMLLGLTAGWLADKVQVDFEIFKNFYKLNYLYFDFI